MHNNLSVYSLNSRGEENGNIGALGRKGVLERFRRKILGRRFIYKGAEYTYRRGSLGRLEVWNTIFKVWVGTFGGRKVSKSVHTIVKRLHAISGKGKDFG